ncbi:alpha,alpha-trehalase [Agromyces marinus]|uniref:Alpha,alpha-trehalase n=1 Tax=Agromyces marinus TaxID=1389020 RepID=A0ABM8H4N2_9MICO|nr:alpha,alpha-trehalase [Agromyces marinus]UIP59230.1 Cytoplasmic trehalase [Agromyces marinus]BDZ55764.1 hypothetical protein GCM10025870_28370 [Agromyces marinus]
MADRADEWRGLDALVETWWDQNLATATPEDVANDERGTLIELPRPYSTAGGGEGAFPEMYGWDTYFISLGMLEHGRADLVRDHLVNQLSMIDRFGMVLNGNRSYYLTRSQPPLTADSLVRYLDATGDLEFARESLRLLEKEYDEYWCAAHHSTDVGLATNRDLGDPGLRAELAAEAETGLDFTPIFNGDVRRCAPLLTNSCLVRVAEALSELHSRCGDAERSAYWAAESERRAAIIRSLCWSPRDSFFRELDVERGAQLDVDSLSAFWTMWAGVATETQAAGMVQRLAEFRGAHGLAFTPRPHPSPHAEFSHCQWDWPVGWPPMQIIVVSALLRYGFDELARAISADFVGLQIDEFHRTGALWEKYNVIDGGTDLPLERYPSVPMRGWSAASIAVLGAVAYGRPATTSDDIESELFGA